MGKWVFNAVIYAMVICLLFYYALQESFEEYGLYSMGTTVFTGICMTMQCKVAFLHDQWTWPQFVAIAISVGGMLIYFALNSIMNDDFYWEALFLYDQGLFWLFGFVMIPLWAVLIDVVEFYILYFFYPTYDMIYSELARHEQVKTTESFA
jgi:hypothetical protein